MKLTIPASIGAGALAGSVGYYLGHRNEKKDLAKQEKKISKVFSKYNQEENSKIKQEAFMNGVEYALSGAEGAEKKAFVEQYVNEAFKEEFEKVAGPRLDLLKETVKGVGNMIGRDAPAVGARLKEGVSLKNAREYVMARTAAAGKVKNPVAGFEGEGEKMNEYANSIKPKAMKDLGIAGGAIGGAALIGMGIKRALKNPGMAEKAMAFMKANKGKIAIGAGAGAAGAIGANAVFGKKDTTVNNY